MRWLLVVLLVGGCGTKSVSIDQACSDSASTRCDLIQSCSAAVLNKRYGDLATCEARIKLGCENTLADPQNAGTPASSETCTDSLSSLSCADYLEGLEPAGTCTAQVGTTPAGSACVTSGDCATQFCALTATTICGTCQPLPGAGDSCANNGCAVSMSCVSGSLQCQVPIEAGGACDNNATVECVTGTVCVGASTGVMGTCQQEVATMGGSCDPLKKVGPDCDPNAGLTCDTAQKVCVAQPLVGDGQPCGTLTTVNIACSGGGVCLKPSSTATTAQCFAPAADGAACNQTYGPRCLSPAKCVGSTGGTSPTMGTCELLTTVSCS